MIEIGKQYSKDDKFKAAARLHQSKYRVNVLKVDCNKYGNRLKEIDAIALLNYYDSLGVREVLRSRYRNYSELRDADMLRSEHIPFNFFAPLRSNEVLTTTIIKKLFGIENSPPFIIQFEYAPGPKKLYLNDAAAFYTYISFSNNQKKRVGIGIEVKYTEKAYSIGKTENEKINNFDSRYWKVTRNSSAFLTTAESHLMKDEVRQIWRNHILGLAMCQQGDIDIFYSVTLFPKGNKHFIKAINSYKKQLNMKSQNNVLGCTYEDYIDAIDGNDEILKWKKYLVDRYIVHL
ncbi:MAG: hypothetical protein JXI43_01955 [Tissierellales bacterium]|nr:hypothetical protein [Tissierellales bacterium]